MTWPTIGPRATSERSRCKRRNQQFVKDHGVLAVGTGNRGRGMSVVHLSDSDRSSPLAHMTIFRRSTRRDHG